MVIWRSRLYLEIATEFGDGSNLEFRIEFGVADFLFGDCDCIWNSGFHIWRSRSNLEIAIEFGDRYFATRYRWPLCATIWSEICDS